MESDPQSASVRDQLREIRRGEVAPWVVYPATPVWWAVAYGLWSASFALVIGLLEGAAQSLAQLGLVVIIALMAGWDRRRRGTYPSGRPPPEFTGAILRMLLGAGAVAALAWLVGAQVSVGVAAAVAGLGAFVVVSRYDIEYAAIAARVRERLQ